MRGRRDGDLAQAVKDSKKSEGVPAAENGVSDDHIDDDGACGWGRDPS